MKINLCNFVHKHVYAVLRNGDVLSGLVCTDFNNESGCHFWIDDRYSYTVEGNYWTDGRESPKDIMSIDTKCPNPDPRVNKYGELIGALQEYEKANAKVVKMLQALHGTYSSRLPINFNRDRTLSFLENLNMGDLVAAFRWSSTPQGDPHWQIIAEDPSKLTDKDRIQLQEWVIASFQQ